MNRAERRRGGPSVSARKGGNGRRRVILYGTLGVIALLIVAGIAWGSRAPKVASDAPTIADLKVGQVAPAFSVTTTSGPVTVPAANKKPTLLEVFATWCPHCQRETAVLNKVYGHYGDKINLVAVSGSPYGSDGTSAQSEMDVYKFTQRFKTQYPVAFDPQLAVMKEYLQGGYPTIVVIGRDDTVKSIQDGEITQESLQKNIDAAL
jgi:thiol-disulfide isomerase/thioredoxin